MAIECTCDTTIKNGVVFICLKDPHCPEHGEPRDADMDPIELADAANAMCKVTDSLEDALAQIAALRADNARLREALRRIYDRANVWFATEPLEIVTHGGVVHGAPIPEIIQEACAALAPGVRP